MIKLNVSIIFCILTLAGCGGSTSSSESTEQASFQWSVDTEFLLDGGPGRDGIPSIDIPSFLPISQVDYMQDDELILAIKVNGVTKGYPHKILDWHEVVNDSIDNMAFVLSYCPLTGTGMAWEKNNRIGLGDFGVSGLLLNTNLIIYDRDTQSYWPQMLLRSAKGVKDGTTVDLLPVFETTWKTFVAMYPQALVLDNNTGFNRNYEDYPYGFYRTLPNILFDINNKDDLRLHPKERILGVKVNSSTKAYVIDDFANGLTILNEQIGGQDIVIFADAEQNFAVAFQRKLTDGTVLNFIPEFDLLPIVASDNEGNRWDINGMAVSGPRQGSQLPSTYSYNSYWLAWASFFPSTTIHNR